MINFSFLNDCGNYESRKVGRTDVNGIIVSTAHTSDEGYETALIDKKGVHPVERYSSLKEAQIGHKQWEEKAKTIEKVIKLGAWGCIEDESITISR